MHSHIKKVQDISYLLIVGLLFYAYLLVQDKVSENELIFEHLTYTQLRTPVVHPTPPKKVFYSYNHWLYRRKLFKTLVKRHFKPQADKIFLWFSGHFKFK